MMLLNGLLALGALAFTIPLAIHLLYRSKFKTIQWGAMHLLEPVVRINRRRIQWMHLLLLLVRCLLPILLAFCLSLPLLTGCRALPGDVPQTLVIVVDDSLSMAARDASGVSRIERVKHELADYLTGLTRRDEIIWIPASEIRTAPSVSGRGTMGTADALARLRNLAATTGPFDLAQVIRAGITAADHGSHLERRVMIVSDFQSCNVNDAAIDGLRTLTHASPSDHAPPLVQFWDVGGDASSLENVSVDSIETLSPAVVPDRQTRFAARVRNASDTPVDKARVSWAINGVAVEPELVSIPARSTSLVHHTAALSKSGIHEISVSVDHPDALIEDNQRSMAVEVIREIDVVLVDGQPGAKPLEGETDYLAIALSPFAFAHQEEVDAVRASVISPAELLKRITHAPPNIIVLANVASLSEDQQTKIAEFVYAGGSLILFDGQNLDDATYAKSWKYGSTTMPLPAKLEEIVGVPSGDRDSAMRLGDLNSQYTPWSRLAPAEQRPLSGVDVHAYRKLVPITPRNEPNSQQESEPESELRADAESVVLLAMANGDPVVVSAQRGRGRIVQFAIPCDDSWTSLPLRRVYLPMMQQLTLDLIGSGKATTVSTGEPMLISLDEFRSNPRHESTPQDAKDANVVIPTGQAKSARDSESSGDAELDVEAPFFTAQTPHSSEVRIELPGDWQRDGTAPLLWTQTNHAGLYRFRQLRTLPDDVQVVTSTIRVAEVPAEESQLRATEGDRLTAVAEIIGATLHRDVASIQDAEQTRRFGREIWRWFLYALLIAMVLEMVVQQQLVQKNRGGVA